MMRSLRYVFFGGGLLTMALAAGFIFQLSWATGLWPWPDGPLSYLFIGSMLAAVAVAALWISAVEEWGSTPAGALNILVLAVLAGGYYLQADWLENRPALLPYGIIAILAVLASGGAFLWSRRIPIRDTRPTPRLVLISFGVFMVVLLLAGGALVARMQIFPWPLNRDSAVIFGSIFLGDAFYFLYGLLRPCWHNARMQLLSFLIYDLVLIVPFVRQFAVVQPDHLTSLTIYVIVLVYSGILSIYYLFLDARTRSWNIQGGPA
jgi:hypothetical protein